MAPVTTVDDSTDQSSNDDSTDQSSNDDSTDQSSNDDSIDQSSNDDFCNDCNDESSNSLSDPTSDQGSNDDSTVSTISANFVTVHPHIGNTYWVGADGDQISLINNNSAVDPTYNQLLSFIKEDKTDEQMYIPGQYTCGDFAETVHNNAEKAGYRAGWVTIDGVDHCCNAFQTSDEGMIYIDCTGSPDGGESWDSSVKLANGIEYQRIPLFMEDFYFDSMGIISSYEVYW